MQDFIARLTQITRKELRYIEGFLSMYRERYAEHRRDLQVTRALGDTARAKQIEEDLQTFRREIAYFEGKQASVSERLQTLARDECFTAVGEANRSDAAPAIPNTANILFLGPR